MARYLGLGGAFNEFVDCLTCLIPLTKIKGAERKSSAQSKIGCQISFCKLFKFWWNIDWKD